MSLSCIHKVFYYKQISVWILICNVFYNCFNILPRKTTKTSSYSLHCN